MSKVPLHEYEKAVKKNKIGNAIGMTLFGSILVGVALLAIWGVGSVVVLLWTHGMGGWAVGLLSFFAVFGLACWLTSTSDKIIQQGDTEGVIDE